MIYNITQHNVTLDQSETIRDLDPQDHEKVKHLLTFEDIPSREEMERRAWGIINIINKYPNPNKVMIGGAPFFMSTLERVLIENGIIPVYAFSRRESVEISKDGSIVKTNVFKHIGIVSPYE